MNWLYADPLSLPAHWLASFSHLASWVPDMGLETWATLLLLLCRPEGSISTRKLFCINLVCTGWIARFREEKQQRIRSQEKTEAQVLAVGPIALGKVWDIGQINTISPLYLRLYTKRVKLDKWSSIFSIMKDRSYVQMFYLLFSVTLEVSDCYGRTVYFSCQFCQCLLLLRDFAFLIIPTLFLTPLYL